jgi:hypothetical protein
MQNSGSGIAAYCVLYVCQKRIPPIPIMAMPTIGDHFTC